MRKQDDKDKIKSKQKRREERSSLFIFYPRVLTLEKCLQTCVNSICSSGVIFFFFAISTESQGKNKNKGLLF